MAAFDRTAFSALILAGQREEVTDPLCEESGVAFKAALPLEGRPMINYVIDALEGADLPPPFHVSGFSATHDSRLVQAPSGKGPAESVQRTLDNHPTFPMIVTTADHPLLTSDMVTHFLIAAHQSEADFCVGLAERSVIAPAYPNVKRTYLNFSDRSVSGCNLFYIRNVKGAGAINFWTDVQHDRKRPLKLASHFGWSILWRFATRQLSVEAAFDFASDKIGCRAAPVFLPFAEAAIDVDKPSDKILVEAILNARERGSKL